MLSLDISIDIDAIYKLCFLPAKGYYCYRDLNHITWNCPTRLDIWQLTTEQQEKLMEDLNTLKNIKIRQYLELEIAEITDNILSN